MNKNQQAKELSVNGIVAFMLSLVLDIQLLFEGLWCHAPFRKKQFMQGGISLLVLIGTILGWKEKRAATSGVNRSLRNCRLCDWYIEYCSRWRYCCHWVVSRNDGRKHITAVAIKKVSGGFRGKKLVSEGTRRRKRKYGVQSHL